MRESDHTTDRQDSFFAIQNRRKRRILIKVFASIVAFGIAIGVMFYYYPVKIPAVSNLGTGMVGSAHTHAAFMLVLDGRIVDFSKFEYMLKDDLIHVEDMNGNLIHNHAIEVNLGRFFSSLGMGSNHTDCFIGDDDQKYCDNAAGKRFRLWVNGEELLGHAENYVMSNNDRVLLAYGDEEPQKIQQYLSSLNQIPIQED